MANLVKDLLDFKGNLVWSVTPQTALLDALKIMAEKNIGALTVLDGDKLVGIISERDMVRKLAKHGMRCEPDMPVKDIMITEVYVVKPEATVDECMQLMTMKHFRHLPVVKDGKLVGLIALGDVVKHVIKQKNSTIISLENFILGKEFTT